MLGSGGAAASYGDLLITSLVVLMAVCIGAFVVVKVVGRVLATGRVRGAHLLDVVARVPLEPRRSLYVVEVAGKTLLVGTSEMGLSVLSELDGGEVRARLVPRQSFGELVRAAWQRRRGGADVSEVVAPTAPSVVADDPASARTRAESDRSSSGRREDT
ncbi:MAG: flagellar biosynthetic protein FliO [Deltaproteobacteria bacterium]|nr:flagellar biosynthetic protein FliO [Deltaproteobacteria bacterium]